MYGRRSWAGGARWAQRFPLSASKETKISTSNIGKITYIEVSSAVTLAQKMASRPTRAGTQSGVGPGAGADAFAMVPLGFTRDRENAGLRNDWTGQSV